MILCSDNGAEQISFVAAMQTPIKEIRYGEAESEMDNP